MSCDRQNAAPVKRHSSGRIQNARFHVYLSFQVACFAKLEIVDDVVLRNDLEVRMYYSKYPLPIYEGTNTNGLQRWRVA